MWFFRRFRKMKIKKQKKELQLLYFLYIQNLFKKLSYIYIMATHRNNAIYVKRWKEKHREKYLENNRKCVLNYYYFKKQVQEFLRIDPTLFS